MLTVYIIDEFYVGSACIVLESIWQFYEKASPALWVFYWWV